LFRREWRQQTLVLALITIAVAATTVGLALATNASQSQDATLGTANSQLMFPGSQRNTVAAAHKAFGRLEEIDHQNLAIPGSVATLDVRAQDPNGLYGHPTLRLVAGRYPVGPEEIAMTVGATTAFNVHIGNPVVDEGHTRRLVGIVENPLDLTDEFALVAPGQANPPAQIGLLFDATDHQLNAFQPAGNFGIDHRVPFSETNAAVIILVFETVGLLFVGLLATAGFAVMAQRRLRALGMLGALGATDRNIRLAMIANGAVVGGVAAISGAALGGAGWIAFAPSFATLAGHRIDRFNLPWWAIAAAVVLAVATSITAAWWPARGTTRTSIVSALSGRPSPPKPAHRFASLGGVFLTVGFVCLAFANGTGSQAADGRHNPNAFLIIAGTLAITLGMLLLGPLLIRALATTGRRAPIALRLALRDLARYQARSAAALAAISLALAIAATIALSAAAAVAPPAGGNLPDNELLVHLTSSTDNIEVDGQPALPERTATQLAILNKQVQDLAVTLHARAVVPLTEAIDPRSGTVPGPDATPGGPSFAPGANSTAAQPAAGIPTAYVVPASLGTVTIVPTPGGHTGSNVSNSIPLYVATTTVLQYYGINAGSINANADILTSRTGLGHLVVTAPRMSAGSCATPAACSLPGNQPPAPRVPVQWQPVIQNFKLPAYTSAPNALLTPHALATFGLTSIPAGWLIEAPHALTTAQITGAQHAAAADGASIETRPNRASFTRLRNDATAAGILVALGVLAMTVGLIRSETANDLRTLTATGASSTTRRTLTGATASALALMGALLAVAVAYLALVAWHRSNLEPLTQVPILDLAVMLLGFPLVALGGGWLLAGREPPTISHQPLE
jgi:putative ABC transport system permease protein